MPSVAGPRAVGRPRAYDEGMDSPRATSPEHERLGAAWELLLKHRFERAGWNVERHPRIPGTDKRPDLLLFAGDDPECGPAGASLYVEATVLSGFRPTPTPGGPATTNTERFQDVLLSRLAHKSRSYQGADLPLLVAVLALSQHATEHAVEQVLLHGTSGRETPPPEGAYLRGSFGFFSDRNEPGRNVSAVLVACGGPAIAGDPAAIETLPLRVWRHPQAARALPREPALLSDLRP